MVLKGSAASKCNLTNAFIFYNIRQLQAPGVLLVLQGRCSGIVHKVAVVIVAAIIVAFFSCFSISILLYAIFMRTFQRLYFIDFFPQPPPRLIAWASYELRLHAKALEDIQMEMNIFEVILL